MPKISSISWALFGLLLSGSDLSAAEITAGAARAELTPPKEMKATLGGYGARMSQPAEGVHDPVFVKGLVISDGRRRFGILTADILGFPPAFKPALIKRLADKGWTEEELMLLPSHSHTSIDMSAINPINVFGIKQIGIFDPALFEWTIERCAAVVRQAESRLVPAAVGTASATIKGWNRNRRDRDGPTDEQLTVTRIDDANARPLAVLVNFTAHPTFMGPEHMLFSGGWPGHLQRALERLIEGDVTVLYYNGAEGDQSPVGRSKTAASRWEAAEDYGKGIAVEAHALWTDVTTDRDVAFAFNSEPIDLPSTSWHPDFMKTGGDEYGLSEKLLEKMLPLMFPAKTNSGSLRLGELIVVGVPGEMAADLGLAIKAEVKSMTGANQVTIGGLANEWVSYILSAEQYRRGGYEASVSFYGADLGQTIVDGAVAGVKGLQE